MRTGRQASVHGLPSIDVFYYSTLAAVLWIAAVATTPMPREECPTTPPPSPSVPSSGHAMLQEFSRRGPSNLNSIETVMPSSPETAHHEPPLAVDQSIAEAPRINKLVGEYSTFIDQYGRGYRKGSKEYERRLSLFSRRAVEVEALNNRPNRLWTAGINALSDRTDQELSQLRGWRGGALPQGARAATGAQRNALLQSSRGHVIPENFLNWTSLKSLEEVQNQGSCGSCWAITSATVLDTHSEIYSVDRKRSFSAQELVNCVPNPHSCGGDGGCDGATVELAFHYAMKHGLSSDDEAPYQGITGSCREQKKPTSVTWVGIPGVQLAQVSADPGVRFGMRAWERLPENKYEPLLLAVMEWGPVGVSVAASNWYAYASGVFDNCEKDAVIDHAVVLIGFGKDRALKEKFWLIQNSWGSDWGEGGRIRLLRRDTDESEQCGVDTQPELGTGCRGGPSEVTVCGMCGILYDSVVPHFRD